MNLESTIGLAIALLTLLFVFLEPSATGHSTDGPSIDNNRQLFSATYGTPLINGVGDDAAWQTAQWLPLDQIWIGAIPSADDFSGRYKIACDENNLYISALSALKAKTKIVGGSMPASLDS